MYEFSSTSSHVLAKYILVIRQPSCHPSIIAIFQTKQTRGHEIWLIDVKYYLLQQNVNLLHKNCRRIVFHYFNIYQIMVRSFVILIYFKNKLYLNNMYHTNLAILNLRKGSNIKHIFETKIYECKTPYNCHVIIIEIVILFSNS